MSEIGWVGNEQKGKKKNRTKEEDEEWWQSFYLLGVYSEPQVTTDCRCLLSVSGFISYVVCLLTWNSDRRATKIFLASVIRKVRQYTRNQFLYLKGFFFSIRTCLLFSFVNIKNVVVIANCISWSKIDTLCIRCTHPFVNYFFCCVVAACHKIQNIQ